MQHVYNISITDRAAKFLREDRARSRLDAGDVLAFGFISRFVNADGSTVHGFEPGYMATAQPASEVSESDLVAQLPDGTVFYFMPKFQWEAEEHYLVDLVGFMFSIGPA
jgi:hypothetical protein